MSYARQTWTTNRSAEAAGFARRSRGGSPQTYDTQPLAHGLSPLRGVRRHLRCTLEADQNLPAQLQQEEGVARIRALIPDERLERAMGIEPTTFSLGS